MKVVILVRSTADYANMSSEKFASQVYDPYKPKTELHIVSQNNILKLWEDTFKINYMDYRFQLVKIAEDSRQKTGCEIIIGFEEFINWYRKDNLEAIIIPTDDDDWVSPNIGNIYFSSIVTRWTECVYGTTERPKLYFNEHKFGSNNWAIKKSFLKSLDDKQARGLVLLSHKHAARFFEKNLQDIDIDELSQVSSLYCRHIGSLTYLRNVCEKSYALEKPKISDLSIDKRIAWSQEYMNILNDLNQRL